MAFSTGGSGGGAPMADMNVTPLVDVMLVLLIIFMVTATVITPGVINIPSAGKSTRAPDKRVDVLVDGKGDISLAGELQTGSVTETEAVDKIKQLLKDNPDMPVMLAADSDLQYKQVMGIMRKLREAGVQRVGLSVK